MIRNDNINKKNKYIYSINDIEGSKSTPFTIVLYYYIYSSRHGNALLLLSFCDYANRILSTGKEYIPTEDRGPHVESTEMSNVNSKYKKCKKLVHRNRGSNSIDSVLKYKSFSH